MQPWAQWALATMAADPDPMLAVFLRMASRTVPGRWGMQISREAETGRSWREGWHLEPMAFGWAPQPGAVLHLNGEWVALIRDQEADDAFPAVLAHVQSWVRVNARCKAVFRSGNGPNSKPIISEALGALCPNTLG